MHMQSYEKTVVVFSIELLEVVRVTHQKGNVTHQKGKVTHQEGNVP